MCNMDQTDAVGADESVDGGSVGTGDTSKVRRLGQLTKEPHPRVVRDAGRVIVDRLVQSLKARFSMEVTVDGIATYVNPLHPANANFPMEVTVDGIATYVNPLHPSKTQSLMDVIEDGIVIDVIPLHLENAPFPMDVTEDGIDTAVNPLHPENASSPIDVTEDGMVNSPTNVLSSLYCPSMISPTSSIVQVGPSSEA
jgi:hypothetical protein